jgi:3-phosphoshikimate 1-carboxyvinyltransferase
MPDPAPIARPLTATHSRGLKGRFRVPGEPTPTALTLLLAALARGETVIYADTGAPTPEVAAVLRLLAELGTPPETHDDRWQINGLGALGLLAPQHGLQFGGAPLVLPLALGLLAPYDFASRFEAGPGLAVPRPLLEALRGLGTTVEEGRTGRLPIILRGPRLGVPFVCPAPPVPGANWVEAMLLAGLGLPGRSRLAGLAALPEAALRLFRHFGAEIEEFTDDSGLGLTVSGLPKLGARTLTPAGDSDIAALAIVAALIVPGSDVVVENVTLAPAHTGLLQALGEMGGRIERLEQRQGAGEVVIDLRVRHSALLGITVEPAGLTPASLVPLAVAAAFAAGATRLPRFGIAGEAERHRQLATALSLNGATAQADANGLVVGRPRAGGRLGGSMVEAGRDPLFAAAMLVFGLGAAEPVSIADDTPLRTALPDFLGSFAALGAHFIRRSP